jgi:hypothetical protein
LKQNPKVIEKIVAAKIIDSDESEVDDLADTQIDELLLAKGRPTDVVKKVKTKIERLVHYDLPDVDEFLEVVEKIKHHR